ncbi:MAG: hypothetical protein IQL11_16880 [Bacteroidales bacterium]|nr:hypothetical protein [Bacteroidales bacterium]
MNRIAAAPSRSDKSVGEGRLRTFTPVSPSDVSAKEGSFFITPNLHTGRQADKSAT